MICTRCTQRLARLTLRQTSKRTYSTPVTAQTTTSTVPRPSGNPAATSRPEHAQPFSTPLSPAPQKPQPTKTAAPRIPSSAPAGTVLKGLNFIKGKQDPVALEDHEYPDWLWSVLEKKGDADGVRNAKGGEGDEFSKSKKERQRAAKAARKRALQNPESLAPKVPLYEQSIDLYSGDGSLRGAIQAGEARQGLTKAMRDRRRSKIKEANFLKAMS